MTDEARWPDPGLTDAELLDLVVQAGRAEVAPRALGEGIKERLRHQSELEQVSSPPRGLSRPRTAVLWAGLGAAAALAVTWFVRFPKADSTIQPESASAPNRRSSPLGAAAPPADPCRTRRAAEGGAPLIDDFEDGDDAVAPLENRAGFWRWAREIDAPGTAPALLPALRPEAGSGNRLAIHVKGGALRDWGAVVETSFRPPCYDASRYAGIAFEARGPGRIYVAPREVSVIPLAEGGTCELDCHNPHVKKVDLTEGWQRYEVRWAETWQRGVGKPALDPSRLNSFAFLIRPEDTPYDVWLDEVRFLVR
jgi:hypothetical protein